MSRATWKATERRVGGGLGGERVPVTGRGRGDAPDVRHERYAIEVKHRKALPVWLKEAFAQAVASKRGGQIPIVVLHELGMRHDNNYVIVRQADVQAFFDAIGYDFTS